MDKKREINTIIFLLFGLAILSLTHFFSDSFSKIYDPKNHLSLHILLEFLGISITIAIVMQGWMIFSHTLSRHRLYVGGLFFCIAIFDILHVLSYNGMPFFIMETTVSRPTWFWVISRMIMSIGLFVILIQKDKAIERKFRYYFFTIAFVGVVSIAASIYLWADDLPLLVVEGAGVTDFKKGLEHIISFFFFSTIIMLMIKYRKKRNAALLTLITAIGFSLYSELIFTFYKSVHDFENLLGHLFKLVSYYFLMKGLYASTIEEPFYKQKEAQKALCQSEQRLNTIVSSVPSGIIIIDSEGIINYVNKAAEVILGVSANELLHYPMDHFRGRWKTINETTFPLVGYYFNKINQVKKSNSILSLYIKRDGEKVYLAGNSTQMFNEEEELLNTIYSFSDVTDLMVAQEKINHLAYYDELTGLPNRHLFKELVEAVLKKIDSYNGVAVLLINLNRFRVVNDSLGNDTGDAFIETIACRLREYSKLQQFAVARFGGDEFAIIYTDARNPNKIEAFAKNIIRLLQEPLTAKEIKFHIDATIGISLYTNQIHDHEQFIQLATIAMHEAKKTNKAYLFYHQDTEKELYEKIVLENELRRSIENRELLLYYQPQVNLDTGKIIGMEALVRWNHPKKGMISPMKFIPVAEETGLIVPIGKWVIEESCRQIKSWLDKGYSCSRISVNLSMRQFIQEDLVECIAEALEKSNLDAKYLELEITESMTMDVNRAIFMMKKLKKLGVRIAIDDFGTGYSSISNLHHFPVDQLKIDQSFIRNLSVNSANEAIVGTIISLGHHLQLELMAEGVETKEEAEFLSKNRCNGIQGYLISKPLSAFEIEELLRHEIIYDLKSDCIS